MEQKPWKRPRATIGDVPSFFGAEKSAVIFFFAVVIALVLRQVVGGIGDVRIVARVNFGDAQAR